MPITISHFNEVRTDKSVYNFYYKIVNNFVMVTNMDA